MGTIHGKRDYKLFAKLLSSSYQHMSNGHKFISFQVTAEFGEMYTAGINLATHRC